MGNPEHSTPDIAGILKQRGAVYGDVRDNMNCALELIAVWEKYRNGARVLTEYDEAAHSGCMSMVFHKIARICTGNFNADNYADINGYTELARKIAMGEKT